MDFVHLHLHTEYSLLDGACRIDELLDQAVKLKMPAIAVTEHGNMFSSVIFHDHARARGLNPILGCEVYVAPGSRLDKSGNPGATQNHLVLLAENLEGYHNLIKLVSSGYTDGFYYKPRIDKALLAEHASGLIGLSSCLKGEVAEGLAHAHDVLLCIGTGKAFSDPKRLRYDARQFFLKTPEEMAAAFRDYPDALANTLRIAERCNVTLAE